MIGRSPHFCEFFPQQSRIQALVRTSGMHYLSSGLQLCVGTPVERTQAHLTSTLPFIELSLILLGPGGKVRTLAQKKSQAQEHFGNMHAGTAVEGRRERRGICIVRT